MSHFDDQKLKCYVTIYNTSRILFRKVNTLQYHFSEFISLIERQATNVAGINRFDSFKKRVRITTSGVITLMISYGRNG